MKKKKPVKKATEFWVEICESELTMMVLPDAKRAMTFIKYNGPSTIGTIEIKDQRVVQRIKRAFKQGFAATSIPWDHYCEGFGYPKVKTMLEREAHMAKMDRS